MINYFKLNSTKHEYWFENYYLKPLELINRKINNDFEGIICNNKEEIAFFELKLVTLTNIQREIDKQLKKYEDSEYLHELPKQEEIKSRLRDIIAEAARQVLLKMPKKKLPRIIYLINDNSDFNQEDIIYVIKSKREIVVTENGKWFPIYGCECNKNKSVLDLFDDKSLSGLICLILNSQPAGYISEIIGDKGVRSLLSGAFYQSSQRRPVALRH